MNKLFRIFAVTIIAFGWLFMSPITAQSDDPITIGAQRLEALYEKVSDLTDAKELISLISVAQTEYNEAVISRDNKISAEQVYAQSGESEAQALESLYEVSSTVESFQSQVDSQTPVVNLALDNKNDALNNLQIANINLSNANQVLQSAGNQGVSFEIYPLSRMGNTAYIAPGSGLMCQGSIYSFDIYAGSGAICGLSQNIIGIFRATLTLPEEIDMVYFAGNTDDGFRLYIDGQLATQQWVEQGATWSPYTQQYNTSVNKTLELEAWWYNGGGPGSMHVGYGYNGIWTGINPDYLSYGESATQEQINEYNTALAAKQNAQSVYNDKLSVYNQELLILNALQDNLDQAQDDKSDAQNLYQNNQTATQNYLIAKDSAIEVYNQSIYSMNNALTAAEEEYISQWDFEEKQRVAAAIATALANQVQPSPDPTPESTPTAEPSPEPTSEETPKPDPTPDPTKDPEPEPTTEPTKDPEPEPTPTPETTPKPEPTKEPEPTPEPTVEPEPTPEPTVEPTVEPTPEPTPGPEPTVEPEPMPEEKPGIENEELAALVPEKGTGTTEDLSGVIANLTSKDNKLVTLSPEQVAAVSQTLKALTVEAKAEIAEDLGIAPAEVAKIAEQMKDNPALASAFVEFSERAGDAGETPMPFTLADAVTEVQTEAFIQSVSVENISEILSNPTEAVGALLGNTAELLSNFSELGMDMTDDQREKAQEVIIPVIIVSQIANVMVGMRR